jgi:hypothetical protein
MNFLFPFLKYILGIWGVRNFVMHIPTCESKNLFIFKEQLKMSNIDYYSILTRHQFTVCAGINFHKF